MTKIIHTDSMVRTVSELQQFAKRLLIEHNVNADDWVIKIVNVSSYYGQVTVRSRTRSLSLSGHLLYASEAFVQQIILHEIAHILTLGHNHDEVWKNVALRLGVNNPGSKAEMSHNDWEEVAERELRRMYKTSAVFHGVMISLDDYVLINNIQYQVQSFSRGNNMVLLRVDTQQRFRLTSRVASSLILSGRLLTRA